MTVWGLSFKSRTDDVRSTPGLQAVRQLREPGTSVVGHSPVARDRFREAFGEHPGLDFDCDIYGAAAGSRALPVVTEWDAYRNADLDRRREEMAAPSIVDGRRVHDSQVMDSLGFPHEALGLVGPSANCRDWTLPDYADGSRVAIPEAQSRFSRYHWTSRSTPSANETDGTQSSNCRALLTSAQVSATSDGWRG